MTTDKLSDQCLQSNDNNNAKLISHNKRYEAVMQGDGNFVIYSLENTSSDKRHVVYETDTYHKGHGPYKFYSQNDGNLVIYDSKNNATWSSKTANVRTKRPGPYYCRLFDSGSLKAFDKNNEIMWSSPIDHNLGKL
ncbi:hypothetical protein DDB_G0279711 [Dictyostelium discoideum AX4]|uniref:Bulb-type lectin domain-containing protein n=1 Tax=Dictyostelium discoideum TaxID=44689 RepID=Q54WE1_DICDI|nr:hypothetical protein DDB_G0279711 [Dictyostelium discoideum AX4]EAL67630.1 hypothetical protein DDB_G0279711 [Dictyostelium discoideum AX4]|eukprot:XP_641612.1 hypothetical protein DDB_G0279711 [Dictyostelium discoideum AX4]